MVKHVQWATMPDCGHGWSHVTIAAVISTKCRLAVVLETLGVTGNELARRLMAHPEWDGPSEVADVRRQITR